MCLKYPIYSLWKFGGRPRSYRSALDTPKNEPITSSNADIRANPAATSFPEGVETYNLLRSGGGSKMPVEICLRIVEEVVDADPKSVGVLMSVSKVGSALSLLPHQ
jgi:hypothetical protein